VGVVDVGSNTVRLLVSDAGRELLSLRESLRLGEEVEHHGLIRPHKLAEVADCVGDFADAARNEGARLLEVLVTSPGRQASNGRELTRVLATAAQAPVQILTAQEEGRLAFLGALDSTRVPSRKPAAVVDVGGGSTQLVVGTRRNGPSWCRSVDLGSLRLMSRCLPGDPPGPDAMRDARREITRLLDQIEPPDAATAFAVGGTARALRRLYGSRLGRDELRTAVELLSVIPGKRLSAEYGISAHRAATLPAGAVILEALQRRLGSPLKVVRSGLRHGALLELTERSSAEAA
jgi:exopolyphosphatase/guanosine-5'-triphosphate,3'-diphosphate pyrophosphatase